MIGNTPRSALIAEARRLYRNILRGREVRSDSDGTSDTLSFILGRQCIAIRPMEAGASTVRLEVDDPLAVAEECWDAGYTVHASDPDDGDSTLSVIDPFGRHIELAQTESIHGPRFTRGHHSFEVHR